MAEVAIATAATVNPVELFACIRHKQRWSVLAVFDAAFVSWRDRVFAYNRAMDAHRRPFTTARVSQHFCGGLICLNLGIVDAGCTV